MKFAGVRKLWHGVAGLIVLSAFFPLEFYTNLFEKSVGYYLKWQNHKRPQLGRMWERDRQSLVAQAKIKSIRSSLDLQEETTLGISSFKHLFEGFPRGSPLLFLGKNSSSFILIFRGSGPSISFLPMIWLIWTQEKTGTGFF